MPIEPCLAKCLLSSLSFGCSEELLTIAAMCTVDYPFISVSTVRTYARLFSFHLSFEIIRKMCISVKSINVCLIAMKIEIYLYHICCNYFDGNANLSFTSTSTFTLYNTQKVKSSASMESKQRLKDCIDELYDPNGDHLTLLKIFNSFQQIAGYVKFEF